jgi:excisionase family DNA binding protein
MRLGEEPKTQTIDEAAKELGIGRNQAYAAARRGEIPTIRIGKRILVLREPLRRLLDGSPSEAI